MWHLPELASTGDVTTPGASCGTTVAKINGWAVSLNGWALGLLHGSRELPLSPSLPIRIPTLGKMPISQSLVLM